MVHGNPLSYVSKPYTEWLSFPVEDSNSWGHHANIEMVINRYSLDSWPTPNHDLNQWCILIIWNLYVWHKNTRSFINMLIFCPVCVCCVCYVCVCCVCNVYVCRLSSICALVLDNMYVCPSATCVDLHRREIYTNTHSDLRACAWALLGTSQVDSTNTFDDNFTVAQVMRWCHQPTRHYLS